MPLFPLPSGKEVLIYVYTYTIITTIIIIIIHNDNDKCLAPNTQWRTSGHPEYVIPYASGCLQAIAFFLIRQVTNALLCYVLDLLTPTNPLPVPYAPAQFTTSSTQHLPRTKVGWLVGWIKLYPKPRCFFTSQW
ncbi:hypothetical protein MUP77_21855 [Candidatus Bathyarchaeota archaeon]|nr:hypothetical protein [Candidatus Bathyarchaeota archaeon]